MKKMIWGRKQSIGLAWLLVFAMLITGMGIPAGSVKAAETVTVTNATNKSNSVYVEFIVEDTIPAGKWGGNSPAVELTQYKVKIYNNTSETISDWKIEVEVSDASSWNAGWNGADIKGNIITIGTYKGNNEQGQTWDNMEIAANSSLDGPGFQMGTSEMNSAINNGKVTLTYNKGASSGVPSEDGTTGSGGGSTGSGGSGTVQGDTTTDLGLNIEYNYAKLLQYSLYFYDANMCGELEGKCALDWRRNCHTYDKTAVTYNGKTVDVSGGFHDAGDHDKFGLPQGYAASILGIGYYEYKEAYEKAGQTEHFKTILDYFCDYFVRCTVVNANGEAEAFCYQVGDGNDHSSWTVAEKETINRPAYFANASKPATDQVSEAAAALAIHYKNFGNTTYLEYAKKLFAMAQKNSKSTQNSDNGDFYVSSSWADDYCLAAAWLYKVTGDHAYKTEYDKYKGEMNIYGWPSWDQVGAYAKAYGEGDFEGLNTNVTNTLGGTTKVDNGYAYLAPWGSARYNTNMQLEGLIYDKNTNKNSYTDWAEGQMQFLLGNNSTKRCYVVGYNANSSKYPHHRTASGYAGTPNKGNQYEYAVQAHVLVGALVGGIMDANGTYDDSAGDYTCNEVAIDYNAAFTGAAAALFLLNENDGSQYTIPVSEIPGAIDDGSENPLPKYPSTGGNTGGNTGGTTDPSNPGTGGNTGGTTDPSNPGTGGNTGGNTGGTTDPSNPGTGGNTGGNTGGTTDPSNPGTGGNTGGNTGGTKDPSNPGTGGNTGGTTDPSNPGTGGSTGGTTDPSNPGGSGTGNGDTGNGGSGNDNTDNGGTGNGNTGNGGTGTGNVNNQNVKPTSIKITGPKKVAKKKKVTLKATVLPQKADQTITWTSSKKKVATVDQKGKVKGKKPGKVVITAKTSNGITKKFPMRVMKKAVKKIKLKAKKTMKVNKTIKIKVSFTPKKQISKDLLWTSSNPGIATVNAKGQVKAKKKGKVRITAKATDGSNKKKTIRITIK